MWDDTPLGEIGIPELQKIRGFETPHMNKMAEDGINFMRMETHYSVIRPDDFGNESVIRFQFTPVIPNPFK